MAWPWPPTCLLSLLFPHSLQRCAPGSHCSGDANAPCVADKKKERCPGPYDDLDCVDSRTFCLSGHKTACPVGTRCTGSLNGEMPCKHVQLPGDAAGAPQLLAGRSLRQFISDEYSDGDYRDEDGNIISDTNLGEWKCPGGDNRCTDDTTYCHDGYLIACPGTTRCKEFAPCVKLSACERELERLLAAPS